MNDKIFLQFYFKRVSNFHIAFVTLCALYVMQPMWALLMLTTLLLHM